MAKMVKTELETRNYGYAAYAECPICGARVRLGGYVHFDEAPSEMPVDELASICSKEVTHTREQADKHGKANLAWDLAGIVPDDYVR